MITVQHVASKTLVREIRHMWENGHTYSRALATMFNGAGMHKLLQHIVTTYNGVILILVQHTVIGKRPWHPYTIIQSSTASLTFCSLFHNKLIHLDRTVNDQKRICKLTKAVT